MSIDYHTPNRVLRESDREAWGRRISAICDQQRERIPFASRPARRKRTRRKATRRKLRRAVALAACCVAAASMECAARALAPIAWASEAFHRACAQ